MSDIYFVTNNKYKYEEIEELAKPFNIKLKHFTYNIREIQTMNREKLIRQKTLEAFKRLRYPVIVDHASLEIEALNSMPGSLTQLFWDNLRENICKVVDNFDTREARAVCTVGYCDGRKLYSFEGVVKGKITESPNGKREFQWDTIFQPNGEQKTYAEMDIKEKNQISQRKIAFDKLFNHIKS